MTLVKRILERWKSIAHKIGNFQARALLSFFYFLILAPFALIVRRKDPLRIRKTASPDWHVRIVNKSPVLEDSSRQW